MTVIETPPVPGRTTFGGRLDTTALPSNQPAVSPLYPAGPWKAFNSKSIAVIYETDLEPVLDLLPPELSPMTTPPQVICLLHGAFDFATGGGAAMEMTPLIPVLYEGEPHLYRWVGYLGEGTEERFAAGREMFGDQSKLARIEFEQRLGRGVMMGTVERPAGHRLVTQIVGPVGRQCDAGEFELYPTIGIRVLPDSSGQAPEVAELYRSEVHATLRRAADGSPMLFSGPGTVVLGVSEQDPLYRLPVRRVAGAYYAEFGTLTHGPVEVVRRYAQRPR
jgi:acetoacetate decarboxylase